MMLRLNHRIFLTSCILILDKALPARNMEDSPIPPILSTVKKWPKSSHMAPPPLPTFDCGPDDDVNPCSTPDLPEPPEMTVAWSEVSISKKYSNLHRFLIIGCV